MTLDEVGNYYARFGLIEPPGVGKMFLLVKTIGMLFK